MTDDVDDGSVIIPDMTRSFTDDISVEDEDDDIAAALMDNGAEFEEEEEVTASGRTANDLLESIPAMVSITRVPKNPPAASRDNKVAVIDTKPAGMKKGGPPPPLLRVGGLPPMPRLKLGNSIVRTSGAQQQQQLPRRQPIYPPNHPIHSMMNINTAARQQQQLAAANQPSGGASLPVIAGTMSLQSLRQASRPPVQQRPGMRMGVMPGMRPIAGGLRPGLRPGTGGITIRTANQLQAAQLAAARHQQQFKQKTVFRPSGGVSAAAAASVSRPVQVRTVFVPPPMNMSGGSLKPNNAIASKIGNSVAGSSAAPSSHKIINAFPLNRGSNAAASAITITPLSNGKTNGGVGVTSEDMMDELELDEEDDGVPEDDEDDEYNEITEAPSSSLPAVQSVQKQPLVAKPLPGGSIVPIKNLLPHPPAVSGSVTLHRLLNKKEEPPAPPPPVVAASPKPPPTDPAVSRRNSVDSVGSSAASIDSNGQPRPATARKSFKPSAASSSPAINGGVGSLLHQSLTLKRRLESPIGNEPAKTGAESAVKKQKTGGIGRVENFPASFGTHFMSSLLGGPGLEPSPAAKAAAAMRSCDEVKMEAEEEEKPADSLLLKTLCTCEAESIKIAGKEGLTCQAVEVVGGHRVGCKNKISRSELVKTSPHTDPVSLCDLHRDRLLTHCCCPICGEFCSHGLVFMCRVNKDTPPHLFHRFCYQTKAKEDRCCPHCSSKRAPLAVQLKMTMTRTPLKILNHTSKIATHKIQDKPKLERWQTDKRRQQQVIYALPSGKVLSADGLPKGLETEKLELMLEELKNKALVKHTTRNMYQPTAAGENVKLLQLLALDYSPRQRFAEANGGTPLHVAAAGNHVLTAHILVQAGGDLNALDDSNETPLMIACSQGFADTTRYLLSAGARVDLSGDDGMTALHFATQNGHLECAHVILSQNRLPRNFINVKDDGGWTPLVWACEHKHEAVIRYLVEQGADPFVKDVEMNISLHWAAFSGSKGITDLLLAAGCNVNQANAIGETPLHIALRQDHYECALLLIARGARLDVPNQQGQLPSSCLSGENPKLEALINLGTTLHKLMKDRIQKFLSEKTVIQDISNGKENIPISAVNGEDFEMGPAGYKYVKEPVVTKSIPIDRDVSLLQHCRCKDNCVSEDTCRCADNSTRSWYDQNGILKEGFDYDEPPMIFECNEMCDCNQNSCNNRVVQHGITARLQVYKTYGMGWGAKAAVDIPKGGFVCEYVGELISDAEAEQRENDSYLFDLENREGETFCLDANRYGNVARFINHSCAPNLVPVKVFTSHQDLRFPHIALFASKPIKKGDVLGFDYGEKFWVIKHKFFTCWCGGEKCKYSKHSIGKTLHDYYKKMENAGGKSPDSVSIGSSGGVSGPEEQQKQTGKLKLKLRMEEGKVVKVDDSGLLPGEPKQQNGKRSPKRDELKPKRSGDSGELKPKKSADSKKSPDEFKPKKSSEYKKSPKHSPKHEESASTTTVPLSKTKEEKEENEFREDRKSPIMVIKKSGIVEFKPGSAPTSPSASLDNGILEKILEPAEPLTSTTAEPKSLSKKRRMSTNSKEKVAVASKTVKKSEDEQVLALTASSPTPNATVASEAPKFPAAAAEAAATMAPKLSPKLEVKVALKDIAKDIGSPLLSVSENKADNKTVEKKTDLVEDNAETKTEEHKTEKEPEPPVNEPKEADPPPPAAVVDVAPPPPTPPTPVRMTRTSVAEKNAAPAAGSTMVTKPAVAETSEAVPDTAVAVTPVMRRGRGRPPKQDVKPSPSSPKKAATTSNTSTRKSVAAAAATLAAAESAAAKLVDKPASAATPPPPVLDKKELRVLKNLEIDLKIDSRPSTPGLENGSGRPKRTRKSLAD